MVGREIAIPTFHVRQARKQTSHRSMPLSSRPSNYRLRWGLAAADEEKEEVKEPEEVQLKNLRKWIRLSILRWLENLNGMSDITSYLKRFEQYVKCMRIKDEQAMATLAWHWEGNARLWLESLQTQPAS